MALSFSKKFVRVLRRITYNRFVDFYCLNFLHSFRTKNNLELHKKVCENHDYCYMEMPKADNIILKCSHGEKSMKAPFIIYFDESLLEKMCTCHNNPKKSSITKINKYATSSYSLFTHLMVQKIN